MDFPEKTRCPNCKSKKTRVRIKTNERVCEHCGRVTDISGEDHGH